MLFLALLFEHTTWPSPGLAPDFYTLLFDRVLLVGLAVLSHPEDELSSPQPLLEALDRCLRCAFEQGSSLSLWLSLYNNTYQSLGPSFGGFLYVFLEYKP